MALTYSVNAALGRGKSSNKVTTEHKWNHLLGIELELENVTMTATGEPFGYGGTGNYPYEDDDDWEDLDYDEREERIEAWQTANSPNTPEGWTIHSDSSLRNGYEFVTAPAVSGKDLEDRIDTFYEKKFTYVGSPRTSTHIHIDMGDSMASTLQSMVMLVYTIEDALFRIVDEGRKWSGYSVALIDMPPSRLRNLLNPPSMGMFTRAIDVSQNRDRYYGLNFNVARHGTLEFRYFPGAPSKEDLHGWVDLVVALKNAAIKYPPEALALRCDTANGLISLLTQELGVEWTQKFSDAVGANKLFESFEEVNALRTDEANPERLGSVVSLTADLVDFIISKAYDNSKEVITYLNKAGVINKAIGMEDASYYLENAKHLHAESAAPTQQVRDEDMPVTSDRLIAINQALNNSRNFTQLLSRGSASTRRTNNSTLPVISWDTINSVQPLYPDYPEGDQF